MYIKDFSKDPIVFMQVHNMTYRFFFLIKLKFAAQDSQVSRHY